MPLLHMTVFCDQQGRQEGEEGRTAHFIAGIATCGADFIAGIATGVADFIAGIATCVGEEGELTIRVT